MNHDRPHRSDSESILARIVGGNSESRYRRDQIVYSQGDPADLVFYVRAGTLKVTVVSETGKEAVVAIIQRGNFCGEDCLIGHELRKSTVTALTECVLARMPKASVVRALHDDGAFSELFTRLLVERHIRMQEDLVDQLLNSTEKRLARLLLTLAKYGTDDRPDATVPKISQETLADMVGTSRTHVNFFMNKFRQLGFIEYNGEIKVRRTLQNVLLHEKPEVKS
jgi:CRP/FNR family cyclic AMP-dependent transcriptional regulator